MLSIYINDVNAKLKKTLICISTMESSDRPDPHYCDRQMMIQITGPPTGARVQRSQARKYVDWKCPDTAVLDYTEYTNPEC